MIQQLMRDRNPCPCRGETNINTAMQQVLKCEWADQEYKAAERNTDRLSYRRRESRAGDPGRRRVPLVEGAKRVGPRARTGNLSDLLALPLLT